MTTPSASVSAASSRPAVVGRRRRLTQVAALAVVTTGGTLLATGALDPLEASAAGLESFADCSQVLDWYTTALEEHADLAHGRGDGSPPVILPGTVQDAAGSPRVGAPGEGTPESAQTLGDAVGPGATGTNLQEAGVDEPDVIKTRDGLVMTTVGDRLVVLDVREGAARQLGSVVVPALTAKREGAPIPIDGGPGEPAPPPAPLPGPAPEPAPAPLPLPLPEPLPLPLPEPVPPATDTPTDPSATVPAMPTQAGVAELLVVGDRVVVLAQNWNETGQTTTTAIVDVADPRAPRMVSSSEVEGTYVSARLTGDTVRVVSTSTAPALLDGTATSGEELLPHRVVRDDDGAVVSRTPALDCTAVAHPAEPSGLGTVTVTTLDPVRDDDPVVATTAVAADGDLVYASTERLYVATTRGGWWMRPLLRDGTPTALPEAVTTELHGFDVAQEHETEYVASGEVEGRLLGRWALSAQDGMLRVATTRDGDLQGSPDDAVSSDSSRGDSAVTVLEEVGAELKEVGRVTGLGPGEQIRAVRWFGDVATVVTFRQTDPLYVVDLSDPANPLVRGELKVPGYSAYLHPLGDDLLLGVGQDATETGMTTGMQVSTFDLTDLSRPTRLDVLSQDGTWTAVEEDSRLFSYLPEQRLALLPLSDHRGTALQSVRVGEAGDLTVDSTHHFPGSEWLQRAVVVDDRVVALVSGQQGPRLSVLDLDRLSETATVALG